MRNKCCDASLVIDGSLSFKFNDGTKAIIEILEEDALRTFQLYPGLYIDDSVASKETRAGVYKRAEVSLK